MATMQKNGSTDLGQEASPSQLIDATINALGDWRGEVLGRLRALIKRAKPDVVRK